MPSPDGLQPVQATVTTESAEKPQTLTFGTLGTKLNFNTVFVVLHPDLSQKDSRYTNTPDKVRTIAISGSDKNDWPPANDNDFSLDPLGVATEKEGGFQTIYPQPLSLAKAMEYVARYVQQEEQTTDPAIIEKWQQELLGDWAKTEATQH